jgi:hypothetical protein
VYMNLFAVFWKWTIHEHLIWIKNNKDGIVEFYSGWSNREFVKFNFCYNNNSLTVGIWRRASWAVLPTENHEHHFILVDFHAWQLGRSSSRRDKIKVSSPCSDLLANIPMVAIIVTDLAVFLNSIRHWFGFDSIPTKIDSMFHFDV